MLCIELMATEFSNNLQAQHVNGMTPFDLGIQMHGWLLDTLE